MIAVVIDVGFIQRDQFDIRRPAVVELIVERHGMLPVGIIPGPLIDIILPAETRVIGHTEFTNVIGKPDIELMGFTAGIAAAVQLFIAVRVVYGIVAIACGEIEAIVEGFLSLNKGTVVRVAGGENGHHTGRNGETIAEIEAPARLNFLRGFG